MCKSSASVLLLLAALVCAACADEAEYYLVTDLFRNYDKRLRPSSNHTEVLNVTFGMALNQIMEVDERNQILVTNSWLNLGWVDVRLRWNPSKNRGIEELRLPIATIWTPDIILYNNADPMSHISTVSTNAIIRYDGNVTWLSTAIMKSSCTIKVRDFPFDVQECWMQFASWTYGGRHIDLTQVSEQGDISVYKQNTEWQLMQFSSKRNLNNFSCCPEPWPDITFYIRLDRRPLFYVFNLILPCVLITIVALFSFLVPCDSGEKITTTITTLLSMTVFLLLVTEQLPPSAITLPLIGIYYGLTMAIVSAATIATVLTLNLYYRNDASKEVPASVRVFCFDFLARVLFIDVKAELKQCRVAARSHRVHETAFCADSVGGNCGSPHCPCAARVKNGGMASQISPPSLGGKSAAPLLAFSLPSEAMGQKDTPSMQRLHSLMHPGGSFALCSSPSTCDGTENDTVSSDLRNLVAQKYYNSQMPKPQFEEPRAAASGCSEMCEMVHRMCRCVERQERQATESERRSRVQREWRLLALVIDRCFFWLFILAATLITCILFAQTRCNIH